METSHNTFCRVGYIILNKFVIDTNFSELIPVVGLKKKTAFIFENGGPDYGYVVKFCFNSLKLSHVYLS